MLAQVGSYELEDWQRTLTLFKAVIKHQSTFTSSMRERR